MLLAECAEYPTRTLQTRWVEGSSRWSVEHYIPFLHYVSILNNVQKHGFGEVCYGLPFRIFWIKFWFSPNGMPISTLSLIAMIKNPQNSCALRIFDETAAIINASKIAIQEWIQIFFNLKKIWKKIKVHFFHYDKNVLRTSDSKYLKTPYLFFHSLFIHYVSTCHVFSPSTKAPIPKLKFWNISYIADVSTSRV